MYWRVFFNHREQLDLRSSKWSTFASKRPQLSMWDNRFFASSWKLSAGFRHGEINKKKQGFPFIAPRYDEYRVYTPAPQLPLIYYKVRHSKTWIFSVCAPQLSGCIFATPRRMCQILHNDLPCNDTSSVTGESITYWGGGGGGAQTEKIPKT